MRVRIRYKVTDHGELLANGCETGVRGWARRDLRGTSGNARVDAASAVFRRDLLRKDASCYPAIKLPRGVNPGDTWEHVADLEVFGCGTCPGLDGRPVYYEDPIEDFADDDPPETLICYPTWETFPVTLSSDDLLDR